MRSAMSDDVTFSSVGTSMSGTRQRLQIASTNVAGAAHVLLVEAERTGGSSAANATVALYPASSGGVPRILTTDSAGTGLLIEQEGIGQWFGEPGPLFPDGIWVDMLADASGDNFSVRAQIATI